MSRPDTQPRKEPRQARSRATVDALIEATARLLADEGPDGVITNRIAEVAGVGIGTLYQYYPGREALLAALVERELAADMAFVAALAPQVMARPLRQGLRLLIESAVARFRQPAYLRLHSKLLPLVPLLEREGLVRREIGASFEQMLGLLHARQAELAPRLRGAGPAAERRRRVAAFVAFEALDRVLDNAKVHQHEILAQDVFVADLLRMVESLLLD